MPLTIRGKVYPAPNEDNQPGVLGKELVAIEDHFGLDAITLLSTLESVNPSNFPGYTKAKAMYAFAWIYLLHRSGKSSQSKTGTFYLPPQVVALIQDGMELGHADDLVFQAQNSKQQGGSVGLLTHGLITREAYYQQAMVLALIPFLNESLYPED